MAIFDNGMAPVTQTVKEDVASVPRSPFNFSCVKSFNGLIGALMPFDVMETLPNEDYTISYDVMALSRNPIVRRLQNGMNIYIHTYWCAKRDLWEGWDNYIDKGRSGSIEKEIPKLYPAMRSSGDTTSGIGPGTNDYTSFVPFAPSSFMGVPIASYKYDTVNKNKCFLPCENEAIGSGLNGVNNNCGQFGTTEKAKWGIVALPFVMYAKIKRDYYLNQNLADKNKNWFPDNEHDALILPYNVADSSNYCNFADGTLDNSYDADVLNDNSGYYIPTNNDSNKKVRLNCLYNRAFKGDYFTTSNPFKDLLRGDLEQFNIDDTLNWDDVFENNVSSYTTTGGYTYAFTENSKLVGGSFDMSTSNALYNQTQTNNLKNAFEKAKVKTGVTLNNLRKLVVLEKMLQRNAKTQGTYKELIGVQFGYFPKVHDRKPVYIGGSYAPIITNEVTQTSQSTNDSILGQNNCRMMSANSGYIGKFHSDDYGYIMSIMSIVPDVYYDKQGLDDMWTKCTQDKEYFPLMNNLEPNEIKNKELYISTNDSWNEMPFGYKNRFEELKSRRNVVMGLGSCGELAKFDSATFMKRRFIESNKPGLCNEWLEMCQDNIDMSMFTSRNEPPFDIIVGCNIDKVSPMPLEATPADMGIRY